MNSGKFFEWLSENPEWVAVYLLIIGWVVIVLSGVDLK